MIYENYSDISKLQLNNSLLSKQTFIENKQQPNQKTKVLSFKYKMIGLHTT